MDGSAICRITCTTKGALSEIEYKVLAPRFFKAGGALFLDGEREGLRFRFEGVEMKQVRKKPNRYCLSLLCRHCRLDRRLRCRPLGRRGDSYSYPTSCDAIDIFREGGIEGDCYFLTIISNVIGIEIALDILTLYVRFRANHVPASGKIAFWIELRIYGIIWAFVHKVYKFVQGEG